MAPTINPSAHETGKRDWVFFTPYWHWNIRKQDPGSTEILQDSAGGIKRGDVVTFWKPHKPEEVSIKRVVAIEGDTVYPKRGYALDTDIYFGDRLKGVPDGIPDIDEDSVLAGTQQLGKIVVPYGYVWVEGDNARKSLDSNDFGPISRALVKERAVWIWRGWGEFLWVGDGRSRKERALGSRIVEGRSEIPRVFVE